MKSDKVKTAVVLAAGMGNRLGKLTKDRPKCLVDVNGKPMLQRLLNEIGRAGFEDVLIVTGYRSEMINRFIKEYEGRMNIRTVHNPMYDTTNNVYSLWLAFPEIRTQSGFALFESDLVIEKETICRFRLPDRIALDIFNPEIHCGTVATVSSCGKLEKLFVGVPAPENTTIHKTVNIWSFSAQVSKRLQARINGYIQNGRVNEYYEAAIADLVNSGQAAFEMVDFSGICWEEIDTKDDLHRASRTFNDFKIAL